MKGVKINMFSFNDKISLRQFQILLILYIFGTGVIILPAKAAHYVGRDGWIAFILTVVLAMFAVFVIASLVRRFPHKPFYEYTGALVTRPVAFVLTLGLILKIVIGLACELRFFAGIVKHVLLYNTPYAVVSGSLLLISAYAAGKGIETKARTGQVIVWIIFIPIIFVFVTAATDVDFSELRPVLAVDGGRILTGAYHLFFAFSGIEFILLMSPYVSSHKHLPSRAVSSVLVVGIIMCLGVIITIGRFGPVNLSGQLWPILDLMDATPIPGSFIERQEAIMMSFWILSVFAMVSGGLFFSTVAAKSVLKAGKHHHYLLVIGALTFILSLALSDVNFLYQVMDRNFLYLGTAYMLVLPLILLLMAVLRGINHGRSKFLRAAPFIFTALILSGCWDSAELANRGFVTFMSIDLDEEQEGAYKVSLEMPEISKDGGDKPERTVKTNSHRSLSAAMYGAGASTDKVIFTGHMSALLCGRELLSDREMFKHALDTLIRDRGVSRTLIILAAYGSGEDIAEAGLEDESLMGIYICDFFRKKRPEAAYRQTLDKLSKYLAEGQTAIIPRIEKSDGGIKFSGAAVMADYTLKGFLDEDEFRGLKWLRNGKNKLSVADKDEYFSIKISKYKSGLNFFETDEGIYARISINVDGNMEEAAFRENTDHEALARKAEKNIEEGIRNAYEALYKRMGVDGFNMARLIEKQNPGFYWEYAEGGTVCVMEILLVFDVSVNIKM